MTVKPPSLNEVDYFKRLEIKRLRASSAARSSLIEEARKAMDTTIACPKCSDALAIVEMHGVQVETCPTCHGVWLDAGELETMLDHEEDGILERIVRLFRSKSEPWEEQP